MMFSVNETETTESSTLSRHGALPISDLARLEGGGELDGRELMEGIREGSLDELLEEELGVTKKRHRRRLREAVVTLAKNDVDYRALVAFLAEHRIDQFFNRFIRAGVAAPDDLVALRRAGDVDGFLARPPMHLREDWKSTRLNSRHW